MKSDIDLDQQLKLPLQIETEEVTASSVSLGVAIDHSFPIEQADSLAIQESFNKHLYRPNTYLHKWWARRSGTTFRSILKQLCEDPQKQDYYTSGGLEGKIILDPMMGGGTTVHEAIRLGARVVAYDIDPIPVMQAKASLTHISLDEKRKVFEDYYERLSEILSPLFSTSCPECGVECESQFILYGLRKRCACEEAVIVDSLVLQEKSEGTAIWLDPSTGIPFSSTKPPAVEGSEPFIYDKTLAHCPKCGSPFKDILDCSFVDRYRALVVVGFCLSHGQFFKKIPDADLSRMDESRQLLADYKFPIEDLLIQKGPKSGDLLKRGITYYSELFTPRQLIYLAVSKQLLDQVEPKHHPWLSLIISTSLEFNSLLCGYKGGGKQRPGAIRHVFSHHAYSFPYTALENNPVFSRKTSGTIKNLFQDRIDDAAQWAALPVERRLDGGKWKKFAMDGETDYGQPVNSFDDLLLTKKGFYVKQQDSSNLLLPTTSVDHVVTDPPYYDSVQYSDLAGFFRVWLKWFLPGEADWEYSITDSAVAENSQNGMKYQNVLAAIWSECNRVLKKPGGRLIFTFHHWRAEAWAHLTIALKQAGFRLVTTYTIQSENPISVHIRHLKALKHDSVLVLQPVENPNAASPSRLDPGYRIDSDDSLTFCTECAKLLGICLDADISEEEIMYIWHRALGA